MEVGQEDLDLDFESLLDAALGIEAEPAVEEPAAQANSSSMQQPQAAPALPANKQHPGQQVQHSKRNLTQHASLSAISCDQFSPSPSPAASPLHSSMQQQHQLAAPCSPCWSSDSMQMHASLGHCSSSDALQQYDADADHPGLYSPVRQCSSPALDDCSPMRIPEPVQHQQQHASASTAPEPRLQQQLDLGSLPREVQMRMLCFLSADALTLLPQTSRYFSSLCAEPVLWRRLFCYRWGKKNKQQNQLSWKARYMERDLTELRAAAGAGAGWAAAAAGDAMQDMFVQAHMARRQQVLPRAAIDDLMLVDDDEVAARVTAWRKSRGFDSGPGSMQAQRPADIGQAMQRSGSGLGLGARAGITAAGCGSSGIGYARRGVVVRRRPAAASGEQQQQQSGGVGSGGGVGAAAAAGGAGAGSSCAAVKAAAGSGWGGGLGPGDGAAAAGSSAHPVQTSPGSSVAAGGGDGAAASSGPSMQPCAVKSSSAGGSSRQAAAGGVTGAKRPRQRRRWTQIGNVFCDEMTGWVHVCDETCSEKIIEPCSGLLVCPISGQVSDRMMTCAEEAAEEGDRGDEEAKAADAEAQEEEYGGRLARAFAAGYYCNDEEELLRKCGVRLSR